MVGKSTLLLLTYLWILSVLATEMNWFWLTLKLLLPILAEGLGFIWERQSSCCDRSELSWLMVEDYEFVKLVSDFKRYLEGLEELRLWFTFFHLFTCLALCLSCKDHYFLMFLQTDLYCSTLCQHFTLKH